MPFADVHRKRHSLESLFDKLQASRSEISLKRDSSTGIFLWILRNFLKNFIYRTPPDDCSSWFLHSNQGFIHWSHFFRFFLQFFPFIINNYNYGSLFRKGIITNIFLFSTIIYPKINMNVVKNVVNFASVITCRHTLEKIKISLGKSLSNCGVPRWILKAADWGS